LNFKKKKIETQPKPVQNGLARFFRFGSDFPGFGLVFFGLAQIFLFGSVFPVWLVFFSGFGSVWFF